MIWQWKHFEISDSVKILNNPRFQYNQNFTSLSHMPFLGNKKKENSATQYWCKNMECSITDSIKSADY